MQPAFFIVLIATFVVGFFYIKKQKKRNLQQKQTLRRKRYQNLILQLEAIQKQLNDINPYLHLIRNEAIIDEVDKTVSFMYTLAEAISHIHPKDIREGSLNSALILARDCQNQTLKAKNMVDMYFGGKTSTIPLSTPKETLAKAGCYFCSRPFISGPPNGVRVKIDQEEKSTLACHVCYQLLKEKKKIKVLHFMLDGKALHWTENINYKPNEQFWRINESENILKNNNQGKPSVTSEQKQKSDDGP